jgi:uncharacterized membrane protein
MEPWLETYVRAYGGICPSCRQSLTAPAEHCLRCGVPLRLGVKITELYLLAWGIALTTSLLTAGCGLLVLFCVARRPSLLSRGDLLYRCGISGTCVLGILMAAAALVLLLTRRSFCRLIRSVQWALAALTIASAAICAAAVSIWVR